MWMYFRFEALHGGWRHAIATVIAPLVIKNSHSVSDARLYIILLYTADYYLYYDYKYL